MVEQNAAEERKAAATQALTSDVEDDRDALYILPLSLVPIQTPALTTARLIKNVKLESVVEVFSGEDGTGSGQLEIFDLPRLFNWPEDDPHPDLMLLNELALLPSYDVYSLRIALRKMGVPVNELAKLKLSDGKTKELTGYMKRFTRPLIQQIYGNSNVDVDDFDSLISLFRNPDKKKALESLHYMAEKLKVGVMDVPRFLEDYGDIFLSLSYYRSCLESIEPVLEEFTQSLHILRQNWQLRHDPNLMKTCDSVENTFNNLLVQITGRFENFDRSSEKMWDNLTAERFRKVEKLIQSYHITIGGVLCALWVKMKAYRTLFPSMDAGGPVKRAEFLMSEIRQGIDQIRKIEDDAPMLAVIEG
ncbi:MAG: hypothetical protein ACPGO3_11200 [Magnetospiraceae bacterium]